MVSKITKSDVFANLSFCVEESAFTEVAVAKTAAKGGRVANGTKLGGIWDVFARGFSADTFR
jgi:hypothetical protein